MTASAVGNKCYVIGGDAANCLDPNTAFAIYMTLVAERTEQVLAGERAGCRTALVRSEAASEPASGSVMHTETL